MIVRAACLYDRAAAALVRAGGQLPDYSVGRVAASVKVKVGQSFVRRVFEAVFRNSVTRTCSPLQFAWATNVV